MKTGKLIPAIATLTVAVAVFTPARADEIRDCENCPVLVTVPAGDFVRSIYADAPQQEVSVGAFAIGKYEVTVGEFAAFVEDTGYEVAPGCAIYTALGMTDRTEADWRAPGFDLPDDAPVVCVSWADANAYVAWLSEETGEWYRLLSEAEWDYAAHAGRENNLAYFLRAGLGRLDANCSDCGGVDLMGHDDLLFPMAVGGFPSNPFGIDVMFGNVAEWVADCYNATYDGAPTDGGAWLQGDCSRRIARGGGWHSLQAELAGLRQAAGPDYRDNAIGFRVARDLN